MANKEGHRRFGNVRRRESGRYQIRYPGPDGRMRTGPETYERKSDAERALVFAEAQIQRGPQLPSPHQPDQPSGKFAGLLREAGHDPVVLRGGMGAKSRAAALARLQPQPGGPPLLVVATGPYAGEGFDCPALDTFFLAVPRRAGRQ